MLTWRRYIPRGARAYVAVLVLLAAVKGIIWVGLIPMFLVADEPAHFDNVQYRAEQHAPPQRDPKKGLIPKVMHEGASPEVRLLWTSTLPKDYYRHPHDTSAFPDRLAALATAPGGRETDGQAPAIDYPGLYYKLAVPFYDYFKTSSIVTRIAAIRFLSLLFGVCAVVATFFAAMLVVDDPVLAFVAAAVVALQPMESQQTACVNNDAGVIGISALVFYFQLRTLSALPRMPALGTLLGLALSAVALVLTKPTGYGILPGVGVALTAVLWTQRRDRRIQIAFAAGVVLACVAAIYLTRSGASLTARLAAQLPGDADNPGQYGHENFLLFLRALDQQYLDYLLRSSWGQFGWLDYSLSFQWVPQYRSVFALVQVGTLVAIVTYSLRELDRAFWHRGPLFYFSIGTVMVGVAFILYVEHRYRLTGVIGVVQGRNFLFVLPALAIWIVVGLAALVPARMRGMTAAIIFCGAVCLHASAIITIMRQHYVR